MRKIRETATFETVEDAAELHITMLEARPDTAALSVIIVSLLSAMQSAQVAHKAARRARLKLSAMIVYEDSVLDDLVADVSRKALDMCIGDRSDARYKALLPTAPSVAMRPIGGPDQDVYVANILDLLTTDAAYTSLAALAGPLKEQQDKLSALRAKRDTAFQQEAIASGKLDLARQRLIEAIHSNHPRLQLLFPKQDALVESFFMSPN